RSLQHILAVGRERFQDRTRDLIAAMLAPHRSEHTELDRRCLATELLDDELILCLGQCDLGQDLRRYLHVSPRPISCAISSYVPVAAANPARSTDDRIFRPSSPPISSSYERSGCGIMPTT